MQKFFLLGILLIFGFSLAAFGQVRDTKWIPTHTFTGNGPACTPPVKIFGDKWRAKYKLTSRDKLNINLTLLDGSKTYSLTKNAPVDTTWTSSNQSHINDFFLTVSSNYKDWVITIEQLMDVSQEWSYRKSLQAKGENKLFVSAEGEANDDFDCQLDNGINRLDFIQMEEGMMKVTIFDENQKVIYRNLNITRNKTFSAWIYSSGNYTIKVETSSPWVMDGFCQ